MLSIVFISRDVSFDVSRVQCSFHISGDALIITCSSLASCFARRSTCAVARRPTEGASVSPRSCYTASTAVAWRAATPLRVATRRRRSSRPPTTTVFATTRPPTTTSLGSARKSPTTPGRATVSPTLGAATRPEGSSTSPRRHLRMRDWRNAWPSTSGRAWAGRG